MRLHAMTRAGGAALLGLTLLAGTAQAEPGYLNQGMNLRAGPDIGYPLLASLPPGTRTEIVGCLPGWSWCDVAVGDLRGWIAGVGLQVVYDDQPEPLVGYGAEIGLPLVGFAVGDYWGSHYRDRPFYGQINHWQGGPGDRDRGYDGPRGDFRNGPAGGRPDEGRDAGPGPGFDGRGGDVRPGGQGGFGGRPDHEGGRIPEQGRGPAPGYPGGQPGGHPGGRGAEPGRAPPPGPPQAAQPHGNPAAGGHPGGQAGVPGH